MGLFSKITDSIFPGVGSILGGSGSKQQMTTTTQNAEPWSGVQPYLRDIFGRAQGLANQNPGLAPLSPITQQYQGILANRALSGSPLTGASQGIARGILSEGYLDPYKNPYFQSSLDQTLGDVQSRINSQFQGNNFGSSAHQEWLGRGLTQAAAPMLSQAFQANQDRQLGVLGMAPQLAGMDYADIGMLGTLGSQMDQRAQAEKDAPWTNLMRYQQGISGVGNTGGTSTTQSPYFTNPTSDLLGNAANLAVIGKMIGLFSDRRLKKDAKVIGEVEPGVNLYEFRFINDPDDGPMYHGVMADEVEKVYPHAVGEREGYKTVDYSVFNR